MKKPDIDRNRPLGLYLHIPFCKAKCAYCDFYSLAHSEEKMDAYAAALTRHCFFTVFSRAMSRLWPR